MLKPLRTILKKIKSLDNYSLAILFGLPLAITLLITLLALGGLSAVWYFNLFFPVAFIASFLSGAIYIGRAIDGLTMDFKEDKHTTLVKTLFNATVTVPYQISLGEKLGGVLGFIFGLGIGVMVVVISVSAAIPMIGTFSYFAHFLFGLSLGGLFGGLGSRLGSLAGGRPKTEKITLSLAAGGGLLLAIGCFILILFVPTISVPGIWITTLLASGTHLPVWLCGGIFVLGFTSVMTACIDYFCKASCFLKYLLTHSQDSTSDINQTVQKKYHEYRGAFVGVLLGIALSVAVIVPLVILPPIPMVAGGLAVLGALVFMAITSGLGGVASRIGRLIDCSVEKATKAAILSSNCEETFAKDYQPTQDSTQRILASVNGQKKAQTIFGNLAETGQQYESVFTKSEKYLQSTTLKANTAFARAMTI